MGLLSGLTGGLLDLGMDLYAQDQARARQNDAQDFNAAEAQKNRDYQTTMSNTQYQRATADMLAAGLNPMLAYQHGGAGTPPGATATSGIGGTPQGHSIAAGMQSASQIQLNDAIEERTRAEADKASADAAEARARTPTYAVSIDQMQAQIDQTRESIKKIIQETSTSAYSAENLQQQTENLKAVLPQIRAMVDNLRAQTKQTGKLSEESQQRINQNLPAIEAGLKRLETQHSVLAIPRSQQEAAVNQSVVGALGALLRSISPLGNLK